MREGGGRKRMGRETKCSNCPVLSINCPVCIQMNLTGLTIKILP